MTAPPRTAKISIDREQFRRTLEHTEATARGIRKALGQPSLWDLAYTAGVTDERKRLLDLDAFRAAVAHPAVTGALAALADAEGGGLGDLAFALSQALADVVPAREGGTSA